MSPRVTNKVLIGHNPSDSKPAIEEYKNIFKGERAVAILGSGPSLKLDIPTLPKDCFRISPNTRSYERFGADMVFCLDKEESIKAKNNYQDKEVILMSAVSMYSEVTITPNIIHNLGYSGIVAAGIALYMGGNPVILCGMDLYRGSKVYFDSRDGGELHNSQNKSVSKLIGDWEQIRYRYPDWRRVRSSQHSPLSLVFPVYKGDK